MGGWATVNATGFASYDTTAYLGYARGVYGNAGAAIATNTSDAAGIYNFNTAISAAANLTVGALLCTPTAGRTLTLGANNLTIATGGLFFDDDANVHTISATSGKVMAGSGSDTNLYVTVATAANQTGAKIISAEIADNGSGKLTLVKAGLGTLTASAANTYSGNTIINEGTLQINKASAQSNFGTCDNTVNITVADTSVFAPGVLLSSSVSSPALGTRYVIAISSPTVLVANGTITNSHSGALSAPAISGTIASSPTIEVLYGATLDVTYHRTATWTVESAQTLKGNGTVVAKDPGGANRTIQIDGKVAPGSSAGTLTVTGNVVFANNSVLEIEAKNALLGGDKWEAGYDRLTVAGTVDLGSNAKLDVSLLAGETLALGDKLFIVDNDSTDAVSGLFKKPTGTVLNEGDAFAVGVQGFKVYYAADLATGALTGGNDVALEVVNPSAASGGGTILMVQ
jgi:autotransporter-associated beta strand protein